ncbi:MAG TPA: hypothetical protein VJ622_10355 [Acidimicrobiia bacterium]|nr:hypothetical protein [Acidimicrobiia bacterium]
MAEQRSRLRARAIVGDETGVGIVMIPIDRSSTAGTPFTLYSDPGNAAADPACNASGTAVAFALNNNIFKLPTSGRAGPSLVATTASGGPALEPAWSSDDRAIAFEDAISPGSSDIETAYADGRFIAGGRPVTPHEPGLRHGASWRGDKLYYWKQPDPASPSQGIFSVTLGHPNEVGPYGGTDGSTACRDPAALPDGRGFECVGADTFIKVFPGPKTLNDTDASKPDVERIPEGHDRDRWDHHK